MINTPRKKYLGITVLLLTVTLSLVSTLLILFSARFSTLQQKITANLSQNRQAFEAAQAGLEAAIPYFQTNYNAITSTISGGYLTPYVNSNTQNVTLANGSKYTFVYTNPTANNFQRIIITATGTNADGTSTRTVSQQIQAYTAGSIAASATTSTRGNVSLRNSATLNNTQTNSNINAGGDISFQNSAQTVTNSGVSSNSSGFGSDVQENNSAISGMSTDEYFQSIFGASQSSIRSQANYAYFALDNTSYNSLNGVTGAIIWITQFTGTARISGSTTIGSPTKPVILIVDGDLRISNSATIYGFVFTMHGSIDDSISNSATINGAIASTNNLIFRNSATVNYNSSILNALPASGSIPSYAKVPASWRDF